MSATICTLCRCTADPRMSLLTRDGHVYALCAGCTPSPGHEKIVANHCRATKLQPIAKESK